MRRIASGEQSVATPEQWEAWVEKVRDTFADAFQSDFEGGAKWLNEQAVLEFQTNYPAISKAISYILDGLNYDESR